MICKKGIILAGGTGSRLYPLTIAVNKQLMPIYDKPAIYYPLSVLMLSGIDQILIISSPNDIKAMQALLKDGKHFGLNITYKVQDQPRGLPEAFTLGEAFIGDGPIAMIVGDNFFYGHGLSSTLLRIASDVTKANIFLYSVKDPSAYGVAKLSPDGKRIDGIVEKPKDYISPWAVTGLYFFPAGVSERAKSLKPSARGELEITDLIRTYIEETRVDINLFNRGYVWFDVGTPDALLQASNFVEVIQNRQDILISSPEEISWRMGIISTDEYKALIEAMPKSTYRNS
jgi:glucose-1-phosphate thymidylyltransferase